MDLSRMPNTCSARELGNLEYSGIPSFRGVGAIVAFVNTATQRGVFTKLQAKGFKKVGAYRGSAGHNIAVMLRINQPLKKRTKRASRRS